MRCRLAFSLVIGTILLIMQVSPVLADGIVIPDPPHCPIEKCPIEPFPISQLEIKYHYVDVTVDNQIAITHVDQVFYNPNSYAIEGTYIFPLPADAVINDFTLWVDGQPVQGKVLSAEEARQIYEDIVARQRDPALLEYVGRGAVQATIFPIPPNGERRIELQYSQVLNAENGLVEYSYPLNTEKFSLKPLETVRISVSIKSDQPIRAVYSPSHSVMVHRYNDQFFEVSYEENDVLPDNDFILNYSVGNSEAFHLMTYRNPEDSLDPDGFFLMLLAPKPGETPEVIAKDVVLVLDCSGSMEGEKFEQARQAAHYILEHLNAEDYFGVVAFSSNVESFSASLRPAAERDEALAWLDALSAMGSTDINRALLEAADLASGERPAYVIFLTDGLPTQGETDVDDILNNLASVASNKIRLFSFGVGYDVDTYLLDSLSQEHHGRSTYVLPGEVLDEILSAFYAGINAPVLTDLKLEFSGLSVYDVYPNPLPDLFEGGQIVVVGRYRQGGVHDVKLTGTVNGESREYVYHDQTFNADSRSDSAGAETTIPRLWATRKIGFLLKNIRLYGADQETIDQIVRLSIRYGVVTPYTSYLVTENVLLGDAAQEALAQDAYERIQAAPLESASGQGAVDKAAAQGEMERSDAPMQIDQSNRQQVRIVGARTFVMAAGVWTDTVFDPGSMQTIKIAFASEDYFELSGLYPDLASAFALGERVIALSNGIAYEVVGESEEIIPLAITPQLQITPTQQPAKTAEPKTGDPVCSAALVPMLILAGGFFWRKRVIAPDNE